MENDSLLAQEMEVYVSSGAMSDKMRKVERLRTGGATAGERKAAEAAAKRLEAKRSGYEGDNELITYRIKVDNPWLRKLAVELLNRLGAYSYRKPRQPALALNAEMTRRMYERAFKRRFEKLERELKSSFDRCTYSATRDLVKESAEPKWQDW